VLEGLRGERLGRRAGVPIAQVSTHWGHSIIKTAQENLNIELDLETTIGDFVIPDEFSTGKTKHI